MIFGSPDKFAVEIGAVERFPGFTGLYVQFRFWIDGVPIGDWEERIFLVASISYMQIFCETAELRQGQLFEGVPATEVFQTVYAAFYAYDYSKSPVLVPNLRDRFHLDAIGMGATQDKFGLVIVASSEDAERIIAKDLREDQIIADVVVPFGFAESAGNAYIEWGRIQLQRSLS